ncbi:MAG TPA: hypothetical protein VHU61_13415 [Solirubrobacteraceae bacterium]|jgi:hypothetical protein|nr:hypothetical protein [Solirubrobacteraceae bacterium]
MRELFRTGADALLAAAIMFIGSLGLWLGTPLAWLWIGSQIEGSTDSVGLALLVMGIGVLITVLVLASLLSRLSQVHRSIAIARGHDDPGHRMLESVMITTAGIAIVVFGVWFLLFAGASPLPLGMNL